MPRGDPLAGWQKENLAAPKRNPQGAAEFPPSVYDDPGFAPAPVAESIRAPITSIPNPPRQLQAQEPARRSGGGEPKKITADEQRACPNGDTRWPPPKSSHPKHLQLLLDEKGEKRIYYHLIHKNSAPEAKIWKSEIKSKAEFYYNQNFPPPPAVNKEGKSAQHIQQEKEQAEIENKGRARGAIIRAKMQRKLREMSFGPRGTIWIL